MSVISLSTVLYVIVLSAIKLTVSTWYQSSILKGEDQKILQAFIHIPSSAVLQFKFLSFSSCLSLSEFYILDPSCYIKIQSCQNQEIL